MPRLVLAAISSFILLGFSAYSVATTWVYPKDAPYRGGCDDWFEKPAPSWVSLKGCVLDVDLVILESAQGDYEKLADRKNGLSHKPYAAPPHWVAVWIPVRTQWTGKGLVRAAYRLDSQDVVKWVNTFELADEREKERLWADPAPIRRLSRPGVLPGKAMKPPDEAVQKAFGAAASANLLAVIAGDPPPPSTPGAGILAGMLGLVMLGYFIKTAGRSSHLDDVSAAQQITGLNVSDVKLEIGGLAELRAEERGKKRNTKID